MKNKKIIISAITIIVLSIGFIIYNNYKSSKIRVIETGANITKLSQTELDPYNQMYTLLEKGIIIQPNFEINPIKQKRVFEIKLKLPSNVSKLKFEEWLIQNNYDKIPKEKFLFIY